MTYKYEVRVHGDPKWYSNAVVFATEQEAKSAARAKFDAWTMCEDTRVVTSEESANYRWDDESYSLKAIAKEVTQ